MPNEFESYYYEAMVLFYKIVVAFDGGFNKIRRSCRNAHLDLLYSMSARGDLLLYLLK
jgi:hypothetical protein